LPWAEKSSYFTIFFERFAIDVLQATQTVERSEGILNTSWDETWHILKIAVKREKARKADEPMPRFGIDEKAFRKGTTTSHCCTNLDRSTVEAVSDGNSKESADGCFSQLSHDQHDSVGTIAMDKNATYVRIAKQNIPLTENKIVHGGFYIMKLARKAVDKGRRAEHRRMTREGDNRLAGSRYLWLTGQERLTEGQRERFETAYCEHLETGTSWAFKELLRNLWAYPDAKSATEFFRDWYRRKTYTKLPPMKKVATTIRERLANVLSYCVHGITNAMAEGIHSKIMPIKRRVGGYRNCENFKTAIYFYSGELDLHPQ
jgi:transposase